MWVIGRMTLNQAVVARLLGQEKPRQLIPILIKKVKDSAAQPNLQYHVRHGAIVKVVKVR